MLIEIPNPGVILGTMVTFVIGLISFYVFFKIKEIVSRKNHVATSSLDRMEYYERQLIDMKIRLDSLDIQSMGVKTDNEEVMEGTNHDKQDLQSQKVTRSERVPNMDYSNITTHVLGLITESPMTSRDIQITLGRSREHTSRLLNRLFKEGLVDRNTKTKPFYYSITERGKNQLSVIQTLPATA